VAGGLIYLYKVDIQRFVKNAWIGITITIIGFVLVFVVQLPVDRDLTVLIVTSKKLIRFPMMVIGAMCIDTKL
jgi:hypothetical protein